MVKNNLKLLHLLKQPTYEARIERYQKYATKNQLVFFGIMCAESVLHIYEEKYPTDSRVRDCINLLKSKLDFTKLSESEIKEIRTVANVTYAAANAAYAAASAAAHAAAHAAYSAANAAYAAASAAAHAAYSAANAAYAAGSKRKQQEGKHVRFMIAVLSTIKR